MSKTDFGIITTCYSGDFNLTRGLLASIKYFEPDVPICIIQDGDFSIEKEKQTYNITHVIKKKDVKNEFLRDNCFGSRCTNMIAFWESPFEKYLYLDSDIVLWGKIDRNKLSVNDFHHNSPHEEYSEFIYKTQYCDFDRLFNYVPAIDYKKYNLFNAGVFAVKRGIFQLEQFKTLYELWKEDKSLMPAEPQGMINYLVYFLFEKENLTVSQSELQTVVPVFNNFELNNKIKFENKKPNINSSTIIHWAGTKPLLIHRKETFIKPMLFFRKEHLNNINSMWRFLPIPYLYWEEFNIILKRYYQGSILRYLKSKLKRVIVR